jgi:hypothetical protein
MRACSEGQWLAGAVWKARESDPSAAMPISHFTNPPYMDRHAEPEPCLATAERSPSCPRRRPARQLSYRSLSAKSTPLNSMARGVACVKKTSMRAVDAEIDARLGLGRLWAPGHGGWGAQCHGGSQGQRQDRRSLMQRMQARRQSGSCCCSLCAARPGVHPVQRGRESRGGSSGCAQRSHPPPCRSATNGHPPTQVNTPLLWSFPSASRSATVNTSLSLIRCVPPVDEFSLHVCSMTRGSGETHTETQSHALQRKQWAYEPGQD